MGYAPMKQNPDLIENDAFPLKYLAKQFQRRRFLMYQPIRNKNRPWRSCFFSNRDEMRKHYKGPSIDAPYQILIDLAKQFQRRRFLMYQPMRNKDYPWRPCLLTDPNEMSNLYKVASIDAQYQILIHLAKPFQRRRFLMYQPIRNKNVHCSHVC